jgi:hypothetical protein
MIADAPSRSVVVVVVVVVAAVASLPLLMGWLVAAPPPLTGVPAIDARIAYQLLSALIMVATVAVVRRLGTARFLRVGDLRAPAGAMRLLGVRAGEPWSVVGRNFAVIATVVTAVVVTLQVTADQHGVLADLPRALLLALPFAAVNAAVEEGIVRLALIEGTVDVVGPQRAALLSGLVFGGVHWFGVPGGAPGVLMAGFLGYVLARSVIETRGMGWAWFIHFLQDVVIFALLFATLA